jgi:hypothetical protein
VAAERCLCVCLLYLPLSPPFSLSFPLRTHASNVLWIPWWCADSSGCLCSLFVFVVLVSMQSPDNTTCVPCTPGSICLPNEPPVVCLAGTYADPVAQACVVCPAGRFSPLASSTSVAGAFLRHCHLACAGPSPETLPSTAAPPPCSLCLLVLLMSLLLLLSPISVSTLWHRALL